MCSCDVLPPDGSEEPPVDAEARYTTGAPLQRHTLMSVRRTLLAAFALGELTIPQRSGIRAREEDC